MRSAPRNNSRALLARMGNMSITFPTLPTFPNVGNNPIFSTNAVDEVWDRKPQVWDAARNFGTIASILGKLRFYRHAFPGPHPRPRDLRQLSRNFCDSCGSFSGSICDSKTLVHQYFAIVAIVSPYVRVKKRGEGGENENKILSRNDGKLSKTIETIVFIVVNYRKNYRKTIATIANNRRDEVAISDIILLIVLRITMSSPSKEIGSKRACRSTTDKRRGWHTVPTTTRDGHHPSPPPPPVKGPYPAFSRLRAGTTPRGWPFERSKVWVNGLTG